MPAARFANDGRPTVHERGDRAERDRSGSGRRRASKSRLRDQDRRAPFPRLLHLQDGRDPARRDLTRPCVGQRGRRHPRHLRRRPRLPRRPHAGDRRDHRRLGLQDGAGRQGFQPGGCRREGRRRRHLHLADRPRRVRRQRREHLAEGRASSPASSRRRTSRPAPPSSTSTTGPARMRSSSSPAPPPRSASAMSAPPATRSVSPPSS